MTDWVLRKGTNGWTCLPDRPDTPGNDPWCVNEPWLNFLKAYVKKETPSYTQVGFAYMLMGDTPVSNTDPYATEPTSPEDWVTDLGPHMMMLVPDKELLKVISKDHDINSLYIQVFAPLSQNAGLAQTYKKALEGLELDQIEAVRFGAFVNTFLAFLENLYFQQRHELGFVTESTGSVEQISGPYVRMLLNTDAGLDWWKTEGPHLYTREFVDTVESIRTSPE